MLGNYGSECRIPSHNCRELVVPDAGQARKRRGRASLMLQKLTHGFAVRR